VKRHTRLAPFAFVAFMAGFAAAPSLNAQIPEVPLGKWWKRPAIMKTLGLTPEQVGKLEDIFAKNRRSFVDLKADVEKLQIDVEELFVKKDSDPKKVSAAVDALEQSRLRLRKAATLMMLDMKGVLTDAQWQSILERRDQWRRERMDERRQRGPGQGRERPMDGPPGTGK
jgi:Spy/CpxP family protein refolding chaperone